MREPRHLPRYIVVLLLIATPRPTAAQPAADYAALTRDFFSALDRRDLPTVDRMLCDRAVAITPRGIISTRAQVVNALRRPSDMTPPRREWAELTVHDLGPTSLVTGRVTLEGPANAGRVESLVSLHWGTGARGPCVLVMQRMPGGEVAEAAFWSEVFVVGGGFNANPNAWLVEVASGLKPGRALDVAMGQGRNAVWLASQGWDVTGYDIASEGLRIARDAAAARNLKLNTVLASTEQFDYGREQWNLVAIIYGGGRDGEIARAGEALKHGGVLVLEGFLGSPQPGQPGSGVTFDREYLVTAVQKAGLEVVRYEEPQARTDYGPADARPVRLLARRP